MKQIVFFLLGMVVSFLGMGIIDCSLFTLMGRRELLLPQVHSLMPFNALLNAEQIYPYGDGLFVVKDCSQDEYYDPFLLYYDKNLILQGRWYFASNMIDSVENQKVYTKKNPLRFGHYKEKEYPWGVDFQLVYVDHEEPEFFPSSNQHQREEEFVGRLVYTDSLQLVQIVVDAGGMRQ